MFILGTFSRFVRGKHVFIESSELGTYIWSDSEFAPNLHQTPDKRLYLFETERIRSFLIFNNILPVALETREW